MAACHVVVVLFVQPGTVLARLLAPLCRPAPTAASQININQLNRQNTSTHTHTHTQCSTARLTVEGRLKKGGKAGGFIDSVLGGTCKLGALLLK